MMGNGKILLFAMVTLLSLGKPTSSFVNHTAVQQQQQPKLSNGWSYFFEHPITHAGVQSNAQLGAQAEEDFDDQQQAVKQSRPALPQCGKGPNIMPARSLISERVGGADSTLVIGPWQFLVNLRKSTDPAGVFFCSGSLISDIHVLLAAQCLEKLANCEISCLTVLIGLTNQNLPRVARMTRRVSKFVIHSGYDAITYANDIALIRMDAPVIFSKFIGPVCLPPASTDPDQYAGVDAAIMGWGPTDLGAAITDLKQGKVVIDSIIVCKTSLDIVFAQYLTQSNICVLTNDNKYTCVADVGGPVVINTAKLGMPFIWTQVGINSYTKDCAFTGLKTRVSAFRDWIDQTISPTGLLG